VQGILPPSKYDKFIVFLFVSYILVIISSYWLSQNSLAEVSFQVSS
jgi:hypothetical protein